MATMPPTSLNAHSASTFSPSQLKQDFEAQENDPSLAAGFNEKEILVSRLESASSANIDLAAQLEFLKKKYQGLQDELQSTLQSQSHLEKQYYGVEADLEKSREREEETSRRLRDLEFKFNKEAKDFETEKARFVERESGLRSQIKNLHAQQQQQQKGQSSPNLGRASRTRSVSVSFSPPAFLPSADLMLDEGLTETGEAALMHEAKLANRTVRQQLKEIGTLKATVTQLNEQIAGQKSQEAATANQLKENQTEMERLTLANSTLMEEIESYQLLLENRTLRGQFTLAHHASDTSLAEPSSNGGGFNLGSELSKALAPVEEEDNGSVAAKDELRQLKDENKALALYISKILGKIMSNPVLAEAITHNGDASADQEKAEEAAPAPKQEEAPVPPAAEPKDKTSRFSGFLSPTFGMGGFSSPAPVPEPEPERIGRGVSFDLPASTPRPLLVPSRNSTDSICNDQISPDKAGSGSQSPFRSRRSKSMSITNHGDEKQSSGSGFNFRMALKRMAGPWKSKSNTGAAAVPSVPTTQEEPENEEPSSK